MDQSDTSMRAVAVPTWAGTLSFLFTDAESSTHHFAADADGARAALDSAHDVVRSVVAEHGGWFAVEQGGGDSMVAVFRHSLEAVRASVAMQRELAARRSQTATMRLRGAVVTGDVDQRADGTYVGVILHTCGRLLGAGHGDQVLTTATTWGLVADTVGPEVAPVDLGEHRLRGIERPVRVMQLNAADAAVSFPPLRNVASTSASLPRPATSLIGRADALRTISDLVGARRVTSIVGAGGAGKTRLAIEIATSLHDAFDRVCWIDLAAARTPSNVRAAVVNGAGLHGATAGSYAQIAEALRGHNDLIVLDNCEQVLEAVVAITEALVGSTDCTVLATSREPIGTYGEAVYRVMSLSMPHDTVHPSPDNVAESESVQLFVDRARLVDANFRLDEANVASVVAICRRLDGLPLALEIAAARLATATPKEIADGLGDRLRLLTGSASGHLSRQRTLEASVAWSYELLSDGERQLLRHLSVFSGSFTMAAARLFEADGSDAATHVAQLVRRSLLTMEPGPDGATRYRFLETIRAFALERLLESGSAADVRRAHLQWMVELCRDAYVGFEGNDPVHWVQQCRASLSDIREAIEFALADGAPSLAVAIVGGLGWFWVWDGFAAEIRSTIDRLAPFVEHSDDEDRLRFRFTSTWTMVHSTSLHLDIRSGYETWLRDAELLGSQRHAAIARLIRGSHMCFIDPSGGRELATEGLQACEALGERFWSIYGLGSIALSWLMVSQIDEAENPLVEMERAARDLNNVHLVADALVRRSMIDAMRGDYDRNDAICRELEGSYAPLTQINVTAVARMALVSIEVVRGRALVHEASARVMLDEYIRLGELQHVPIILDALCEILIATGRAGEVDDQLAFVLAHPDPIDQFPFFRFRFRRARALAALTLDDRALARERLDEMAIDAAAMGNPVAACDTHLFQAILARRRGEHQVAVEHAVASFEFAHAVSARQHEAAAVEVRAMLKIDEGRDEVAARMLGAAAVVRRSGRVTTRLGFQAEFDSAVDLARERLGERFDHECLLGGEMNAVEAVAFADRMRGPRDRALLGWDSLTPTECEVAQLAAAGLTNPQIAERLVVGRETVKSHMSVIFRKLEVTNRVELTRAASDRSA